MVHDCARKTYSLSIVSFSLPLCSKVHIGPWRIYRYDSSTSKETILNDQPGEYAMRLALTRVGDVSWELIQPLDEKSIYARFLREHGEGLHHVLFDVDDYDDTIAYFRSKGIGVAQGGQLGQISFTYFDTEDRLLFPAEIIRRDKEGELPPPGATYP